jgi:hypothetical protein
MYRQQNEDFRDDVDYKIGDFEFRKKIGKGQFSDCFKVRFKATGQPYALKRIDVSIFRAFATIFA